MMPLQLLTTTLKSPGSDRIDGIGENLDVNYTVTREKALKAFITDFVGTVILIDGLKKVKTSL